MTDIIIKNGKAEFASISCVDGKIVTTIKVSYFGEDACNSFADAKAKYSSLKRKIGGLIPHVERIEPGAFYFANDNCLCLSEYLAGFEFDLSERTTIARRLSEYLAELQRNGYTLSCDAINEVYINPYSLEIYLYDLTLIRESKLTFEELAEIQKSTAKWLRNSLFLVRTHGVKIPQIIVDIIEKLDGNKAHYRSFNGLFRDLSAVSLQLKKHGTCTYFALDSFTPVVNRIQEAMLIRRQDLSILIEAYRTVAKGKTQCVLLTGRDGVGKTKLVDRFANELTASSHLLELKVESPQYRPYEGLAYIVNSILRTYISGSEKKSKIFKSFISVRFSEQAFLLGLVDEENRNLLGIDSSKAFHLAHEQAALSEISRFNDIDLGTKVIVIHGFSRLDLETKNIFMDVISTGILKNTLFILTDTHVDQALFSKEPIIHLNVEPLCSKDIEGILCNVFLTNKFENLEEIAQQIFNITGGIPGAVVTIIDAAVQLGYIYQGDDGNCWYCSPGFFKKNYLDSSGGVFNKDISESIANDEVLVLRAIASDCYGASFDEIEYVSALPAAKLEATLLHVVCSSKNVKRWNEKYIISGSDKQEILESFPLRLRRELNRRYIDYLNANTSEYRSEDYIKRVAHHHLEEQSIGIDTYFSSDISYARVFWAAAYVHFGLGGFAESRKYISAATKYINIDNLYAVECELARQIDLLDISICEKTTDIDRATSLYCRIQRQNKDPLERAEIAHSYIRILKAKREFQKAFDVGYEALEGLGFAFPKRFRVLNSFRKYIIVSKKIESLGSEFFYQHHENTNKSIKLVHKISAQLAVVCYQYHNLSTFVPVIILHSLELSLKYGATVEFALYLMGYAYIKQMFPIKRKNERIHEYYDISKRILSRFNKDEYVEFFNEFINYGILEPWRENLDTVISVLNTRYQQALASSEAETAGFFSGARFLLSFVNGNNVGEIEKSIDSVMPEIERLNQGIPITIHSIIKGTVRELSSADSTSLVSFYKFLNRTKEENPKNYTILFCIAYCGLMVSFVKRRHLTAVKYFFSGIYKYFLGASGLPYIVYFSLYAFNSYSRLMVGRCATVGSSSKIGEIFLRALSPVPIVASLMFKRWATLYPERYQHLYDYVQAERSLFIPFVHSEAVERLKASFEHAYKNDYKHDALIIGSRICELKRVYKLSEIETNSIESRVGRLSKESGIVSLVANSIHPMNDLLHSKEALFLPYSEESLIKGCEAAIRDLKEIDVFRAISIFECRGESIFEVARFDGKVIFPVEKSIRESLPRIEQSINMASACHHDVTDENGSWFGKDNSDVYQSVLIIEDDGKQLGFIGVSTDMPLDIGCHSWIETVRSKLKLMFLHHKLKRDRISLEMEAKVNQERMSHINHEIRTPINGIVSLADKLQEVYSQNNRSSEIENYIAHIATCARQLVKIHRDVTSLQELNGGKISLSLELIDLHEAILTPFNALKELYFKKGVLLIPPVIDGLPKSVMADGAKISQIVYNLLHNSYKYTERGSVTGSVDYAFTSNGLTLEIIVRDTGIGIAADTARKLKLNGATTVMSPASIKGTGVGLYVVSRFCELMGGNLLIATDVKDGAKISAIICVDIVQNDSKSMTVGETVELDLTGMKLLCVDDDEINQIAYKVKLSGTGCSMTSAMNGWQALDLMKSNYFDLVLMDYDMPGGNGVEIAEMALDLFGERCPPIICVSAYDYGTILKNNSNFENVCDGYFEKVTDRESLLKYLANYLGVKISVGKFSEENRDAISHKKYNSINVCNFKKAYLAEPSAGIQLIKRFISANENVKDSILDMLGNGDWTLAKSILHKLKGQARNVGADLVANEAQRLMKVVESEDGVDSIVNNIEISRLDQYLNESIFELTHLCEEFEDLLPSIIEMDQDKHLEEIDALLNIRSLDVLNKIPGLVRCHLFSGDEVVKECLEDVMSAVQDGKFDLARDRITRIKGDKHAAVK